MSVGIVGLGSVGSKVALSLARTGVGRFHLVDDDLFLPENVVRHVLDLGLVGEHKVDGVAELIAKVSSHAVVTVSRVNLTGQESNAIVSRELQRLVACDLIIDATASPPAFNLLAHTARLRGRPLVWGEVFGGGLGGIIARSRSGKDPEPHGVRRALAAFTQQHPAQEPEPAVSYDLRDSSSGIVTIATDASVSVIADLISEMAVDCLLGVEPSRFPESLYLVGLARGWVFESPLHVIPIDTSGLAQPEGTGNELPHAELEAEVAFVKQLLDEITDAPPRTE